LPDGWYAEGRRLDAPRAPWRRLAAAHPDPHACLGHAAGRALVWVAAERGVDPGRELAGLVRVDGLAGILRVVAGPAARGAWPWIALAAPIAGADGGGEALGIGELWAAGGGGAVLGLGRDRGASAAAALALALASLDTALAPPG
jgi:hypothetical protein